MRRPARSTQEDDVTDPGYATDADRAEQEAPVDPPEISTAGDARPPGAEVSEADALDQQLVARPRGTGAPQRPIGEHDADEADVLEQQADVPVGEDDTEL
jgi:hypothetical protein